MGNNYAGIECKDLSGHITIMFLDDQIPPITILDCFRSLKSPLAVSRGSFAMFGPNNDIPVVKLNLNEHHPLRIVRDGLLSCGLHDKGYAPWNPHITLPENVDLRLPLNIEIHRPYISIEGTRYYA